MKLSPEQRVDIVTAKRRALQYLANRHRAELVKANAIAIEIWPDHQMTSQGAGAAASRIMKALEKEHAVRWSASNEGDDWGYQITPAGRTFLSGTEGGTKE